MTPEKEARHWASKVPPNMRGFTYDTVLLNRRLINLCKAEQMNVAMSSVLGLMSYFISNASLNKDDPINDNFLRTLYRLLETDGKDAGGITMADAR